MSLAKEQAQTWKDWLAAHGARLLLFARGWTPSREDAEDLVQEGIVRLWHYQAERGGGPPDLPLAFTTLRFCGLNHHRSETRRQRREESIIYFNDFRDVWLDPALEDDEEGELLQDALKRIPDKLREVVVMKTWGGLTFAEIAESLAISPNTAASRYRYALERLAGELESVRRSRHGAG
jgi:RNA polymerase sigma-70 factor (ECF subfamily)